ncbi:MAG: MazG-like family protein [archaeon]
MKAFQKKIADFNLVRGWDKDTKNIKDFMLNMCEEVGEAWNIIKWVDEETQMKLIKKHKDKMEDFVGDSLFLILKMAWLMDINSEKALNDTLAEYEKRFPIDKMKEVGHGNNLAGGHDGKKNGDMR